VKQLSLAKGAGFRIGRTTLRVAAMPAIRGFARKIAYASRVAAREVVNPPGAVLMLILLVLQWLNLNHAPSAN